MKVASDGITDPVTVFDDTIDVPWEVDEFWAKFKSDVLPKVKAGSTVELEARAERVAGGPRGLVDQVRAQLRGRRRDRSEGPGAVGLQAGYLVADRAGDSGAEGARTRARCSVKVAEYQPDLTKKYKFYMVPSRWVHELYPVDEIFQRELGIPKDAFSRGARRRAEGHLHGRGDRRGRQGRLPRPRSARRSSSASISTSSPAGRACKVTTGWLSATVDGPTVVDARIATDPERFWDHYQRKVLPKIYDNVMKVTDNRPPPDKQPFHRDLDIEVWMSEPDFRIGVDEEQVSSLEALHEDLYFVTLDFFDAIGRTTTRRRLAAPGKIFPIIHPGAAGQAGTRCRCSTPATPRRSRRSRSPTRRRTSSGRRGSRATSRTSTRPPPWSARVVARADRVRRAVGLDVEAKDDREAARAVDALDALARLHAAGLYRDALSFDHVDRVAVNVGVKDVRARRVIKTTGVFPPSPVRRRPASGTRTLAGDQAGRRKPLVTWDHIISPDESEAIVGQLAAFPEVKAYKAGRSYRGRDMSVLEITQPDVERARLAGEAVGLQADDLHHRPAARERSVVDQPHPAAWRSCSSPTPPTRRS